MIQRRATRCFVASTALERALFVLPMLVLWGLTLGAIATDAQVGTLRSPSPSSVLGWTALLASFVAWLMPKLRDKGPASIRVEERTMTIQRGPKATVIPRASLLSGYVVRDGANVDIELRVADGRVRIGFADERAARELLSELGLGAESRRATVVLGDPGDGRGLALVLAGAVLSLHRWVAQSGPAVPPSKVDPSYTGHIIVLVAIAFLAGVSLLRNVHGSADVGLDYVEIRGLLRRRRIPLARILSAEEILDLAAKGPIKRALELRLEGGQYVRLHARTQERLSALAARIHDALAARVDLAETMPLDLLARAGDGIQAWRRRVLGLLEGQSSYRHASITPEELARVVRNPEAPAEQRIGAALAVGSSRDPALRREIRVAASACVHPRLRIALQQTLKGEPEEDVILDALAETEQAEKQEEATGTEVRP